MPRMSCDRNIQDTNGVFLVLRRLTLCGATGLVIARARRVDNWDLRFLLEGASFAEIISSLGIAA